MSAETVPTELSEVQWQVAHEIAQQLVSEGTDVNELRKTISYLREYVDRENAGKAFFDYLKALVRRGNQIGHSKQTIDYYKGLDDVCEDYLKDYQDKPYLMLLILGWAARLVKYYKGLPIGEMPQAEILSEREAEIQAVTQANTFEVGQEVSATVSVIKKNKVTYEILKTIRLTQREPKLASKLTEGQEIIVLIEDLRNDGSIKRVKGVK